MPLTSAFVVAVNQVYGFILGLRLHCGSIIVDLGVIALGRPIALDRAHAYFRCYVTARIHKFTMQLFLRQAGRRLVRSLVTICDIYVVTCVLQVQEILEMFYNFIIKM